MSKLDQLSEEMEVTREVIGKPPPMIILYGSGLILWIVMILLVFSWIIYVPERISGAITLGTDRQVAQITAPESGMLYKLASDGQLVQKDSPLCLIAGPQAKRIIKSPVTGKLSFLYQTPALIRGALIAAVVPADTPAMMGRMLIPVEKALRVRNGLPVNVTMRGTRNKETLSFSGTTAGMSLVPDKKHYLVTVIFPGGIHLPANALPSTALLEGDAQLITGNRRLIQRIFGYFN